MMVKYYLSISICENKMEKFSRSRLLHVVTYVQKGFFFFQGLCGTLLLTRFRRHGFRRDKIWRKAGVGTRNEINTDT